MTECRYNPSYPEYVKYIWPMGMMADAMAMADAWRRPEYPVFTWRPTVGIVKRRKSKSAPTCLVLLARLSLVLCCGCGD